MNAFSPVFLYIYLEKKTHFQGVIVLRWDELYTVKHLSLSSDYGEQRVTSPIVTICSTKHHH